MTVPMKLPLSDLESILSRTKPLWEELRGQRIFITGGTGFFGKWLLESFLFANEKLRLNASAMVLTRNAEKFKSTSPHIARNSAIQFLQGDVSNVELQEVAFHSILHCAGSPSRQARDVDNLIALDRGTHRLLEHASALKVKRVLFTSSGAVYGCQLDSMLRVEEAFRETEIDLASQVRSAADSVNFLYAITKWVQESSFMTAGHYLSPPCTVARCFTFVGPHLPLEDFAIGNFIRDGLKGGPIIVHGDGTPLRSYMYMSDLTVWLWTILLRGEPGQAYNVGSEDPISIADLAHLVAQQFNAAPQVVIEKSRTPGAPPERYIPSTKLARTTLNLTIETPLVVAIRKTIEWYRLRS